MSNGNKFGEPWYWEIRQEDKQVFLFGTRRNLVMDFVRYGWNGAQPRFNVNGIMQKASEFVVADANRTISQPIANRIVHCVNACAGLTDEQVVEMRAQYDERRTK